MAGIVVGIDGSDESKQALRWALDEASLRNVPLRAVYAWNDPSFLTPGYGLPEDFEPNVLRREAEEFLSAVISEVAGEGDVDVEQVVAEGRAGSVLVEAALHADLLVVGSRGHGGFGGLLLGSVSQQCAQHASCPVLIVRRGTLESAPGASAAE